MVRVGVIVTDAESEMDVIQDSDEHTYMCDAAMTADSIHLSLWLQATAVTECYATIRYRDRVQV